MPKYPSSRWLVSLRMCLDSGREPESRAWTVTPTPFRDCGGGDRLDVGFVDVPVIVEKRSAWRKSCGHGQPTSKYE